MLDEAYLGIALELDESGLTWNPEIGDEVIERFGESRVSILVDPQGLTPPELRNAYVWLPTLEQLVREIETRQGMIYHAGVTSSSEYEAVVKTGEGLIETRAENLRMVFGKALIDLLRDDTKSSLH